MSIHADYGARLRAARRVAGITQTDLAQTVGARQSMISRVEAGRTPAGPALRAAIDRALGASVETFEADLGLGSRRGRTVADREAIERYQLMRRAQTGRLRPGELRPSREEMRDWRRSAWLEDGVLRGILPPGPEDGGELGHDPPGPSQWIGGDAAAEGEALRAARRGQGLSQRALAARVELTEGAVRHYEHGRRRPCRASYARIAQVLGDYLGRLPRGE
jgi:transcriptional regulator with XRE-family HTH domain